MSQAHILFKNFSNIYVEDEIYESVVSNVNIYMYIRNMFIIKKVMYRYFSSNTHECKFAVHNPASSQDTNMQI